MNEQQENARLVALWLSEGLRAMRYTDIQIDWEQGLTASVIVNGVDAGTLTDVYERFKTDDDFVYWLRSLVSPAQQDQGDQGDGYVPGARYIPASFWDEALN